MRKPVAIALCLCLLLQCVARLVVVGGFELNKRYIARNLCENRDKPEMGCCGKCYLRKQIKKVDSEETSSKGLSLKLEKAESAPCVLPSVAAALPIIVSIPSPVRNPVCRDFHDLGFGAAVFRPPSA